MRPFEILTLILIAGTLTALFTHSDRKAFLYLLLGAIAAMLFQHFTEGHRWQFAFAIYILPATYIFHRFQKQSINTKTKVFLSIWFGVSLIVPWAIPVFTLPDPGGEFDVGTETFHWVDSTRDEWFTNEIQNDVRQIMVQVWYPAKLVSPIEPEPYLDFIELRGSTLAKAGAIPEFIPGHLHYILTNSHKELPCVQSDDLFPVVIFSHGITGSRHLHQAMYEYLASRGYIVIAPDHSYDANITIFPDGSIADYRSDITGHPDSISIRKMQMETRFKDIQFILDQLEKIQDGRLQLEITGKMDLGKIAVGGHSYGGSTATVAAHGDNRIKACFVLDSWISPVPQQTIDAGVHVPFLFMGRPTWEGSDYPGNYPRLDNLMAHSSNPKYRLFIKETEHLDFSDIPLFSPIIGWVMDVGSLPAKVSTSLLNELVYGFLGRHLLKQGNVNFDKMINHDLIYQIQ